MTPVGPVAQTAQSCHFNAIVFQKSPATSVSGSFTPKSDVLACTHIYELPLYETASFTTYHVASSHSSFQSVVPPATHVAPVGPVAPVTQVGPVGPGTVESAPVGPVAQTAPVTQVGPVAPTPPVTQVGPVAPTAPVTQVGPVAHTLASTSQ